MAIITAENEIARLRRSGQILAAALRQTADAVEPGITTAELNAIADAAIRTAGGVPSFVGYNGYPAALCTSINDEVVHGIPSSRRVLAAGDIIGLDLGVMFEGMFTDHAVTVGVGKISRDDQRLLQDTKASMMAGIAAAVVGQRIGDISAAVEAALKPRGYGIIRQLTGHGVGRAIHEEPSIPNYGKPKTGPMIIPGLVIAIEPMVAMGGWEVETGDDGWTMATIDGSRAAHFEHTVLVTERGPEIITA